MGTLATFVDIFLHLDVYLQQVASDYGPWVYGLLFLVLFAETGLVVTPILPGDSLLLTAGVLAGSGVLDFPLLWTICVVAVVLGDSTNYLIGRTLGEKLIRSGRVLKREYIDRTAAFFERHGGKTITIARFFPIVRTFSPFMAGVGGMHYPRFITFSFAGTLAWITLFAGGGALFGRIEVVRENLEFGVMGVLALSVLPALYHYVTTRLQGRAVEAVEHEVPDAEDIAEELAEIRAAVDAADGDD